MATRRAWSNTLVFIEARIHGPFHAILGRCDCITKINGEMIRFQLAQSAMGVTAAALCWYLKEAGPELLGIMSLHTAARSQCRSLRP